ncbi:MAG: tyrosine-type recombinase/integrase [Dehalococcoidales bacterium]
MFEEYHRELLQSDRDSKTIARYWEIVTTYCKWLDGRDPDVSSAKEYLSHLRETGYKPNSILLHYHALRLYFEFIGLSLKVKLRKPRVLPQYHDRGDFEAMVKRAELGLYHQTKQQKERNSTLILTLGYTGMRKSELLNLRVDNLDFNHRLIFIKQGKNMKDRTIPMAERIAVPLLKQCDGKLRGDRVFKGLNARSVYRIVTKLARACGLENLHPHSLRHYFATRLIESDVDLVTAAQLLGHSDLNTTALYRDVIPRHLFDAVSRLDNPQYLGPDSTLPH